MLALLESQAVELIADGLCALVLIPFEWQHGAFLIQSDERRPIRVELRVVMLHERSAQTVGIHSCQRQIRSSKISPTERVPILIYTANLWRRSPARAIYAQIVGCKALSLRNEDTRVRVTSRAARVTKAQPTHWSLAAKRSGSVESRGLGLRP